MTRQISYDEVKKHDSEKSTWVVIHHDVYDVTKYLDEHPGGADAILEYAGRDGTQAFEDVEHSDDAREVMKKFKIGSIPENERNQKPSTRAAKWFEDAQGSCSVSARASISSRASSGHILHPLGPAGSSTCGYCRTKRKPGPCEVCPGRGAQGPGPDTDEPKTESHVKSKKYEDAQGSRSVSAKASVSSRASSGHILRPLGPAESSTCGYCRTKRKPGPCEACPGRGAQGPGPGPLEPKTEPHVKAIIVPIPKNSPGSSNTLKWALIALAGAIVIGIALKKFSS